ncbi:hypothetical protein, partial [Klebsiella pneumoniae]|uniref:hypothetical protein n=1 Tax=Klebsiella pneumoniae TaxID=573 RepID=UPI001E2E1E6B
DNKNGNPMVISEQGKFLITVAYSSDNFENVYIYPLYDDNTCKSGVYKPKQAKSAKFNGVLVQLADACANGAHYFYPISNQGINFVINQFFNSTSVYINQGDFSENISAQGFSRAMSTFRSMGNTTGGL